MRLKDLYKQFPFRSSKKFIPIAIEHGFSRKEARAFLETIPRDIKFTNQKELMLPIYGKSFGTYQMDTLIQTKDANPRYFLIAININSRKLYAYPMKKKDSVSVLEALNKFIKEANDIQSLTTDQDHSYITQSVTDFLRENRIDHQTTFTNDHNRLGIINRAIKTLRDLNHDRDFTIKSMNKCLNAYNNSIHSSTNIKPNQFSILDERDYIERMNKITEDKIGKNVALKPKTHVRIINDKSIIGKRRSNLSDKAYVVDSKVKNKYIIRAKDNNIAEYPRYRLYPDSKAKLAETISTKSKRGIIDNIKSYDKRSKKYNIVYSDGSRDSLTIYKMREGNPTRLSPLELEYWSKNKSIMPNNIREYL